MRNRFYFVKKWKITQIPIYLMGFQNVKQVLTAFLTITTSLIILISIRANIFHIILTLIIEYLFLMLLFNIRSSRYYYFNKHVRSSSKTVVEPGEYVIPLNHDGVFEICCDDNCQIIKSINNMLHVKIDKMCSKVEIRELIF